MAKVLTLALIVYSNVSMACSSSDSVPSGSVVISMGDLIALIVVYPLLFFFCILCLIAWKEKS